MLIELCLPGEGQPLVFIEASGVIRVSVNLRDLNHPEVWITMKVSDSTERVNYTLQGVSRHDAEKWAKDFMARVNQANRPQGLMGGWPPTAIPYNSPEAPLEATISMRTPSSPRPTTRVEADDRELDGPGFL